MKIITSQLYQEKTLKRHKRLDSGEHKIETPLLIRIEKEKNYQDNTLFQVCLNVDFVAKYFQEELGTLVQFTKKINWQCVRSTKKGKKYCPNSKGIQEAAIEKAFVESYRQLFHADSTIIDDFLKIVEEEINDNTLVKDLKKLENRLNRIISQERKLVDLHLEDSVDEEVYAKKYKKLTKQKEELLDEKKTLELTIKDENSIKERLKQFKKVLENREL